MKIQLYIILLLCLSRSCFAAYYVATDGDDSSGDGSVSNPWASITYALDTIPDSSTVLVRAGTYNGQVRLRGTFASGVTVRSELPFQAKLRHISTVVTCYYGKGITLEGFDIAHAGPGAGALVIQIQDLIGAPGGVDRVSRITLKNNVIHDSYNNDLLKINNGAGQITVEGNIFYNQAGSDEHIDLNSVTDITVQDNVFFNDFTGSGRANNNNTSSYIVIKDSNGAGDSNMGSEKISIRRNIFLNWEGSSGNNFLLVGEDGNPYFEARDVMIENNLFLGNSSNVMRAPFGVKGGKDITFRNNTITGDLPSMAYAMRLNTEGSNPANENIQFFNNIWSDSTGTMGAENLARPNDFSDTPVGETDSFTLSNNLYWNGGTAIPENGAELVNYSDDSKGIVSDPLLPSLTGVILPRLQAGSPAFADGSDTIAQAFTHLVTSYATPEKQSSVIDQADRANSSTEDILQRPRNDGHPDIGACEMSSNAPKINIFLFMPAILTGRL